VRRSPCMSRSAPGPTAAPGRRVVDRDATYIAGAIADAADGVTRASIASMSHRTVTESVKEQREDALMYDRSPDGGKGTAWGRAVHRCIEAMGRGRSTESLRAFGAAVASDEALDPADADVLIALVDDVRQSDVWNRLTANGRAYFELPVMRYSVDAERAVLTEGVIDAAALTDDEWLIVDWKTDSATGDEWAARKAKYDGQVGAYAEMLTALSQHSASSTIHRVRQSDVE